MVTNARKRYWMGGLPSRDDFRQLIEKEFIDGKTLRGPWAIMTPASWERNGVGKFGPGTGQRYVKQSDGRWLKVEG